MRCTQGSFKPVCRLNVPIYLECSHFSFQNDCFLFGCASTLICCCCYYRLSLFFFLFMLVVFVLMLLLMVCRLSILCLLLWCGYRFCQIFCANACLSMVCGVVCASIFRRRMMIQFGLFLLKLCVYSIDNILILLVLFGEQSSESFGG